MIVATGGDSSHYNYKDVVAQAYCSAKSVVPSHYISAVRRNCDPGENNPPPCDVICGPSSAFYTSITARFPEANIDRSNCFGSLWVMPNHPILAPNPGPGQTDAGLLNMVTISYAADKCDDVGCGPNYCCCRAYEG